MGVFRSAISAINRVIPEVEKPKQRPSLKERLGWSAVVLILYYIMAQIPIYGVRVTGGDILSELRLIFAGTRGSIIELGIGPVVTAGIVLELLVGSRIIPLDLTEPENRTYFQQAQRVAALFFILFENAAYVMGGSYGYLDSVTALSVTAQLALGSFLLMVLDDLVGKWGIGSGISLFILAGVSQRVFWEAFSPLTTREGFLVGAVPALFTEGAGALIRGQLPDLAGLIATLVVFLIVIWAYEVRVEVPIAHSLVGGQRVRYPLRLLYVSNIPIIFTQALYGDLNIVANIVWNRFRETGDQLLGFLASVLGTFEVDPNTGTVYPSGGLMYYVQVPRGPQILFTDPVRALVYLLLFVLLSIVFSEVWVITSGMDAESVARQLIAQGMVMPGRRSRYKTVADAIKRYINSVTIAGGALVGLLAAGADFSGALGTGSGILLAVTIIASFYEVIARERALELYPGLSKFLGLK